MVVPNKNIFFLVKRKMKIASERVSERVRERERERRVSTHGSSGRIDEVSAIPTIPSTART
jgi:uncharacterized membrane protein